MGGCENAVNKRAHRLSTSRRRRTGPRGSRRRRTCSRASPPAPPAAGSRAAAPAPSPPAGPSPAAPRPGACAHNAILVRVLASRTLEHVEKERTERSRSGGAQRAPRPARFGIDSVLIAPCLLSCLYPLRSDFRKTSRCSTCALSCYGFDEKSSFMMMFACSQGSRGPSNLPINRKQNSIVTFVLKGSRNSDLIVRFDFCEEPRTHNFEQNNRLRCGVYVLCIFYIIILFSQSICNKDWSAKVPSEFKYKITNVLSFGLQPIAESRKHYHSIDRKLCAKIFALYSYFEV